MEENIVVGHSNCPCQRRTEIVLVAIHGKSVASYDVVATESIVSGPSAGFGYIEALTGRQPAFVGAGCTLDCRHNSLDRSSYLI